MIIKFFTRIIFFALWIVLTFVLVDTIVYLIKSENFSSMANEYFLIGVVISFIANFFLFKRWEFWEVFFHEISHLFFAILLFTKPEKISVNIEKDQNFVEYSYNNHSLLNILRSHFISLAPYFFHPITFLIAIFHLLISEYVDSYFLNIVELLLGLTYTFHLLSSIKQLSPKQTDFINTGFVYGVSFIAVIQLLFFSFYFFIVVLNYDLIYIFEIIQWKFLAFIKVLSL